MYGYTWQLCNVTAGPDYIPCLDNEKALRQLHTTGHFEHRERHCPEVGPTCLVPLSEGYKRPITWPQSRDKVYHWSFMVRLGWFCGLVTLFSVWSCRYGITMYLIQNWQRSRVIKTGLRLLGSSWPSLVVELSSYMELFTTLILFNR
jgi:hypothetical protein